MTDTDLIRVITLGDRAIPVAPITFGQADAAWSAFLIYFQADAAPATFDFAGPAFEAWKAVMLAVAQAHDPAFNLNALPIFDPYTLYSEDMKVTLGRLLGFKSATLTEEDPGKNPVDEPLLTSITLGDKAFPVGRITLGQAQAAWRAWRIVWNGSGYGGERLAALKGVIYQIGAAADPRFTDVTLNAATLVDPVALYQPRNLIAIARLLGLQYRLKDPEPGEAPAADAAAGDASAAETTTS